MKRAILLVLLSAGCGGTDAARCHATLAHVEVWRGTVDGPAHLAATVSSADSPNDVRVAAARALSTLDRRDVDAPALLGEALDGDGASIAPSLINPIVEALEPLQEDEFESDEARAARVRAKDAALVIHRYVNERDRARLRDAVMGWYLEDLWGRQNLGRTALSTAVETFGDPAADALLSALVARNGAAMRIAAGIIAARENASLDERAAARLREAEREIDSHEFLEWLEGRVREQVRATHGEVDATRITRAALLNRENFYQDGVLVSMRHFCARPSIADRLVALARTAPPSLLPQDAENRRVGALRALEGCVQERHAEVLANLALSEVESPRLRDSAFDRAAEVRERVLDRFWDALGRPAGPLTPRVQWRIGTFVLQSVDGSQVGRFLDALPDGVYLPEQLEGFAREIAQMAPPPPDEVLSGMLADSRWFVRVLGLYTARALNTERGHAAGDALADDEATLRGDGWAPSITVGDIARSDSEESTEVGSDI